MTNGAETPSYRPFYLEIQGALTLDSPLHIGAREEWNLHTDAPILLDPSGDQPFIPGSSLRGVMRGYLERERSLLGYPESGSGPDVLKSLFGQAAGPRQDNSLNRLGRLTVFDACWISGSPSAQEIRDHVKIREETGAAHDGGKFDAEVVMPEGARFDFRLLYEGENEKDPELVLLHAALQALIEGRLRVGAKSGWGYGKIKLNLESLKYRRFQRTNDKELAAFLAMHLASEPDSESWVRGNYPPPPRLAESGASPQGIQLAPLSILEFDVLIQCEGPVLVKSAIPPLRDPLTEEQRKVLIEKLKPHPDHWCEMGEREADHVFIRSTPGDKPYLPGSSLRGVLRSQAIRICRSQLTGDEPWQELFGVQTGASGRKGCIEVDDGYLEGTPEYVYLDHVAIDRITGAAGDAQKFATCGLSSPVFLSTIRLAIEPRQLACAALFGFLLRDLMGEKLWLGSGTSRGYGFMKQVKIKQFRANLVKDAWPGIDDAENRGRVQVLAASDSSGTLAWDNLNWLWEQLDAAWQSVRLREVSA